MRIRFVKVLILLLIGITLLASCGKDASGGGSGSGGDPSFTGAIDVNNIITKGPVVDVRAFGADPSGATDSTSAIQNAINAATTQYSTTQMNFYTEQSQLPVFFAKGTYLISSTLDLSFRNDITIIFEPGAKLLWNGAADGTMIELKCSSRVQFVNLTLDGNGLAGTFVHHSGNGTSEASATHDLRKGKGNVSQNKYNNVYCENQYTGSAKAVIDTIPYGADSAYPYYYSMDDSAFYKLFIRTAGTNGFGMALASNIEITNSTLACPNGIHIPTGGSGDLNLFRVVFSLQANTYGAIYVDNGVHVANIDCFGCYLEGTTKPFFSFAIGSTTGSIKKLGIWGGLFAQNSGATQFIYVPSGIPGAIYIDGARNQSSTPGLTLNVDAASSYVSIDSTPLNELLGNTSYVDSGFAVVNASYTDLDSFHSRTISGEAGYGVPSIPASTYLIAQKVEILVPPYKKLYLTKAFFDLQDTGGANALRLYVYCLGSTLNWTSSAYYGDVNPNVLLYDNAGTSTPSDAIIYIELYNSSDTTAYTPQNYAGWSVMLDNR